MSKLLFIGPPFVGHLNPAISVAMELEARGHEIGWVGDQELLKRLGSKSLVVRGYTLDWLADQANGRPSELRGPDAIVSLWKTYLGMAQAMYALVVDALDTFQPELVLSDQQTFAGALAAREGGVSLAHLGNDIRRDGCWRSKPCRLSSLVDECTGGTSD